MAVETAHPTAPRGANQPSTPFMKIRFRGHFIANAARLIAMVTLGRDVELFKVKKTLKSSVAGNASVVTIRKLWIEGFSIGSG